MELRELGGVSQGYECWRVRGLRSLREGSGLHGIGCIPPEALGTFKQVWIVCGELSL